MKNKIRPPFFSYIILSNPAKVIKMATPTIPPFFFITQPLTSNAFLPAGTLGVNPLPAGFQRNPGPYNRFAGTRFFFMPNQNILPGSMLTPYADIVGWPNGQSASPSPLLSFNPVLITSSTSPTTFNLPYRNTVANQDGFYNDPCYEIWGAISFGGIAYAITASFFGCWLP